MKIDGLTMRIEIRDVGNLFKTLMFVIDGKVL